MNVVHGECIIVSGSLPSIFGYVPGYTCILFMFPIHSPHRLRVWARHSADSPKPRTVFLVYTNPGIIHLAVSPFGRRLSRAFHMCTVPCLERVISFGIGLSTGRLDLVGVVAPHWKVLTGVCHVQLSSLPSLEAVVYEERPRRPGRRAASNWPSL